MVKRDPNESALKALRGAFSEMVAESDALRAENERLRAVVDVARLIGCDGRDCYSSAPCAVCEMRDALAALDAGK